jgi:hypothetical protein
MRRTLINPETTRMTIRFSEISAMPRQAAQWSNVARTDARVSAGWGAGGIA